MYSTAKLKSVVNDRKITREQDALFYFELQRGILLSLREIGILTEIQLRNAEEDLKEQYRSTILSTRRRGEHFRD